jgi:hypothetical protein
MRGLENSYTRGGRTRKQRRKQTRGVCQKITSEKFRFGSQREDITNTAKERERHRQPKETTITKANKTLKLSCRRNREKTNLHLKVGRKQPSLVELGGTKLQALGAWRTKKPGEGSRETSLPRRALTESTLSL